MDNAGEDTLYVLKEEMCLVNIFNTPVCHGKANKTNPEGFRFDE